MSLADHCPPIKMPMATRLYVIKTEHRKQKKKLEVQPKKVSCECNATLVIFSVSAVIVFAIGIGMCVIAYHASSAIMGLKEKDMKPAEAAEYLSESDTRIYRLLYNFRIIGPILMGIGGFVILCCIVVAYRVSSLLYETK